MAAIDCPSFFSCAAVLRPLGRGARRFFPPPLFFFDGPAETGVPKGRIESSSSDELVSIARRFADGGPCGAAVHGDADGRAELAEGRAELGPARDGEPAGLGGGGDWAALVLSCGRESRDG